MFPISLLAGLLFVALSVVFLLWSRLAKEKAKKLEVPSVEPEPKASVMENVKRLDPASNALFATLSHELRTPLNGLLGIIQMMNESKEDEDLQAIEGCARQMLAVITTLVNHSKIQEEWNELPEYREWVSLYELLEQLKKNMAFRAGLRGLDIVLLHENRSLRLRGDGDHLKTIIENAVLGSIEAVSLVEIPKRRQKLQVSWTADEQGVKVSIINPLETFEPDRSSRVQDVFNMTTGTNHSRLRMEYLYWAVSTALLEKYNGVISTSKTDAGEVNTLLTFEMEQMQASQSAKRPVGGLSLDQGKLVSKAVSNLPKNLNVLVAEDDPISRSLLAMVFKHMTLGVDFATNGKEVLDRVAKNPKYDVILMDIDMPIMDGVSASTALRNGEAGELGKTVPIVAVTAFNTLSDESKFKHAGMDYYLPKPVRLKELRKVLIEVIRESEREQGKIKL
ncbi:MAG: response regulator [Opitutaceae bacterium]